MKRLKTFLASKVATTFYWQVANGLIGLGIVYLSGESFVYAPVVISILNITTKYINKTYLQ